MGLFEATFNVDHFLEMTSEAFHFPQFTFKWNLNIMHGCHSLMQQITKQNSRAVTEGPMFYFYVLTFMQESKFFSLFLFIFLLWQASCGEERSRHICPVEYG